MKQLEELKPCEAGLKYARSFATMADAWAACERPDWMFWLLGQTSADPKKIALAACQIARSVLHLVPAGEDRPRLAIETAEACIREEVSANAVADAANAAAYAAYAAADAARAAARAAAYAAAYAAYAARAAARAAYVAVYAADAADAAADAAANAAARAEKQREICTIIRACFECPCT